ncbi:MAG: phosphoenolpyruvate carboxylase [Candidatus Ancillula sp.]|jgi:phosphoenolpyruvate carboxylase|nr:phosphoenolpyruvate carboxylase [Candidatus Ancillula sp.]
MVNHREVHITGRGEDSVSNSLEESIHYFRGLLLRVVEEYDKDLSKDLIRILELVESARDSESFESFNSVEEFIDNITLKRGQELAVAIATFFHLANLCEEHYRVERLNIREAESLQKGEGNALGKAYLKVVEEVGEEDASRRLSELKFHSVFTAHPTEARRRAITGKIKRISKLYDQRKNLHGIYLIENERLLLNEIDALYRTSPIALKKPSPLDESNVVTSTVESTIHDSIIYVFRRLDDYIKFVHNEKDVIGASTPKAPAFFELGSWIGSDRDGNPNVLPSTTRKVAEKFSKYIIEKHAEATLLVGRNLTLSNDMTPPSDALKALWNKLRTMNDDIATDVSEISAQELHRACTMVISKRLEATAKRDFDYGYSSQEQVLHDLNIVQESLLRAGASRSAYGPLQALIWRIEVFGFHLASIEVRQHSEVHSKALEDIRKNGLHSEDLQPRTVEVLDTFRMIGLIQQRYGVRALSRYIVSFTQKSSHISDVYELMRLANADSESENLLSVIPLFETMEDLENCIAILEEALKLPEVHQFLLQNNRRLEVMLGYSDSSKDVGPVAATFALHRAQTRIADFARKNNIHIVQFHGRGGALGRGGGPANRAVLAQPPGSVDGVFKVTEQGEAITARYSNPDLAVRHIEAVAAATLMNDVPSVKAMNHQLYEKYTPLVEELIKYSKDAFHGLVQTSDFANWFAEVTPLEEVGLLPIGSRPAKRGLSTRSLEDLRAIPWVFAWSQARINLAAWYGFGAGCDQFVNAKAESAKTSALKNGDSQSVAEQKAESARQEGVATLRNAYDEWNLFSTLVDNIEMSIAKADERIAARYLDMADRQDLSDKVLDELALTVKWVQRINRSEYPLSHKKVLGQAIQIRGTYVDALSMLQVCALKRLRAKDDTFSDEYIADLKHLILNTVSGVSAGLQNTG